MRLDPSTLPSELRNAIESQSDKWSHCDGRPESALLRLSILRDLVRELHAQKSRCLAHGLRQQSQGLRAWEERLAELRGAPKLEGELMELLASKTEIRKRTRLLPEALNSAIAREKLDRYDRQWESTLAAEACGLGWRFWTLEAWVEITLAEEWNRRLIDQLWPSALVLFVESSEPAPPPHRPPPSTRSHSTANPLETSLWRGRWVLVADPRFKTPADMETAPASPIRQWPGSPPEPPSPHQWKLLFSPKVR